MSAWGTKVRLGAIAAILLVSARRVESASIALAWNPNIESTIAGYTLWYGTAPGTYSVSIDVGNQTTATVTNLVDGQQYYFAVQAYDTQGLKSPLSSEVTTIVLPPPRGLVAAYSFDRISGATLSDSSAYANNGTISGGAAWTADGKFGGALSFDGVDDLVSIADSATLDLRAAMTLEAWVNPSTATAFHSAIFKEKTNGLVYGLYATDSDLHPSAKASIAGLDYAAPGVAPLAANTWTHVATTYDGGAIRLFINGVQIASVPASGLIDASTGPVRIGGDAIWGDYFQGRLDEVRIYDKALTQADIQKDMNTPVDNGLVAAYNFDEGSGTVAADASGNGRTGTVDGATWVATGKYGGALKFDGVKSLVRVADADALDLTTRMTIEAWVYPSALSGWRSVVLKANGPTGLAYGLYANNNAPQPAMTVKIDGIDQSATGTTKIPLSTWTFLSATYDGATLRMFVNGTQVGSRALSGSIVTSTDLLTIGGNLVWGEYFQGRIDNVRIYNRALSAAEILTDMQTPVVP